MKIAYSLNIKAAEKVTRRVMVSYDTAAGRTDEADGMVCFFWKKQQHFGVKQTFSKTGCA